MTVDLRWITTHLWGSHLGREEAEALAGALEARRVDAGETLIAQGEPAGALYILREGAAEVLVQHEGRELRVASGGEGATFGEMTFLTGEPATATVRTTAPGVVYRLSRARALELARTHPELMFRFFAWILASHARTVRRMNEEYAQLFHYLTGSHK